MPLQSQLTSLKCSPGASGICLTLGCITRKIRVLFDLSAEFGGVFLNKELPAGPDFMNSLTGVLLRFRRESIAVISDIEQMFHSVRVEPSHRDFLRFLWYKDNIPGKPIVEYRMNVHLFGNGPSPAEATYGLRRTATDGEEKFGKEAADFVHRNFYVDDGLISLPTAEQAVKFVTTAQAMLATANLRLHKVVSYSREVMEEFPTEDRGKDIRDLDLRRDSLPDQRSLVIYWSLEGECIHFSGLSTRQAIPEERSVVRRQLDIRPIWPGSTSTAGGEAAATATSQDGEEEQQRRPPGMGRPLPDALRQRWHRWRSYLPGLEKITVPRCYHPQDFGKVARAEIHTFSDASKDAIGASVYLRLANDRGDISTTLLFGQSKVAPAQATSIPRLELCGAVLATLAVQRVQREIDIAIDEVSFYTDSKVVLEYIQNECRRFYVYVANRVQIIRKISSPSQWRYVDTKENPADLATHGLSPHNLAESIWPTGRVLAVLESEDGYVHKAEVAIEKEGKRKNFLRPVKELILLVPA